MVSEKNMQSRRMDESERMIGEFFNNITAYTGVDKFITSKLGDLRFKMLSIPVGQRKTLASLNVAVKSLSVLTGM